jgi:nucleoid DNA-binding protein
MIKQEIIEKISKYFKLTHFEAEKIYDDMFQGIIQGVKEDNIADITNLGEFIIKYNNNGDSAHKKTVEFLPTLSLEDEINQRGYDEHRTFTPSPFTEKTSGMKEEIKSEIIQPVAQEMKHVEEKAASELSDEKANVEDEIRKKREEILSKITAPKEETKSTFTAPEVKETTVTPLIVPPVVSTTQQIVNEVNEIKEEIPSKTEEFADIKKPEVEEIHEKSFSDYFTEVKEEKTVSDSVNKTVIPPVENVIPPTAVELHNQITRDQANKNVNYQTTVTPPPYANGSGNGNGNGAEHIAQDNSYYIWYKDSEPNVNDTQTMSYEYELLYQATKEAEYKSKLRIYVTTFIMFFSIVLLLLILSPVIYKYFFTPAEDQQTEEVQQETSSNGVEPKQEQPNNQASVNSLENNTTQNNSTPPLTENNTQQNNAQQNNTPPVTEQPKQEQPKQEQPKQEQPKQEQPKKETQQPVTQPQQNNTPKLDGVTKNAMGWMDDKNRVIYVQLENGKFTIQESAWDSDAKANKRLSVVGGIVPGLKGNVVKVDLGTKGTWFRARFGEFATLEEAKAKAEELRNKEKMKLQALLLTFLLYT